MKRFILSVFSTVLAAGAVVPTAQALPTVDSAFKVHTLRLREFDARNKSEDDQPSYETYEHETYKYGAYEQQALAQTILQDAATWPEKPASAESTGWENAEAQGEDSEQPLSLIERRQTSLGLRS